LEKNSKNIPKINVERIPIIEDIKPFFALTSSRSTLAFCTGRISANAWLIFRLCEKIIRKGIGAIKNNSKEESSPLTNV